MQLPWLRPLWRTITEEWAQQRLSHAHVLAWQPEIGVDRLLPQWIALLLCQQPGTQACGRCKACQLQQAGTHPDYHCVESIDGKAIGVETIRDVVGQLQQTAHQFGARVVWIKDAERMSIAAANALLKTLEEPAPDTYFILTPRRIESLLPTLRSRAQLHAIAVPSSAALQKWLSQQLQRALTADDLARLQRQPHAPVQVLHSIVKPTATTAIDPCLALAQAWFNGQPWPIPSKETIEDYWFASEQLLQDLLRLSQGIATEHLRCPEIAQWAQPALQHGQISLAQLSGWLHSCYNHRRMWQQQSGLNGVLLLQAMWSSWQSITQF